MPAVVLVTERFHNQARLLAQAQGVPKESIIVLPPTDQTEYGSVEQVERIADAAIHEIAGRPLVPVVH